MVDTSATAAISARRPRVLFLGSEYAGWRTRFRSLRRHTEHDRRIRPTYRSVTGWVDGGWIERLPVLPTALKGRARALVEASAFASLRRPDVLWTSAATALGPFLWSQLGPMRRPLVLDLDETFEIREAFAPVYHGRPAHRGLRARALRMQEAALWRSVTLFTPPFEWMADSLRRGGVEEERIRVIPPGVDLEAWSPPPSRAESGDRLRVVFVGQDFWRKGGDLLIEAIAGPLAEYCELDIVTAADVDAPPGIGCRGRGAGSDPRRSRGVAGEVLAADPGAAALAPRSAPGRSSHGCQRIPAQWSTAMKSEAGSRRSPTSSGRSVVIVPAGGVLRT